MNTKLIIIEGLPGSGKSTVAKIVSELLADQGREVHLFQEGNLDHPADYEGVSFYTRDEFKQLLREHEEHRELLERGVVHQEGDFLIPYRKMKQELGTEFPVEFLQEIFTKDIYELPFDQNVRLITKKWERFTKSQFDENSIHIFECCFIQNPVTIGTYCEI